MSKDIVSRCIELYEEHWSSRRDKDETIQFREHLKKTADTPREFITHKLNESEEYALKRLKWFSPAWLHKASNVFYNQNSSMFKDKQVLEIGSGKHIDKSLVELSESYNGVDPGYGGVGLQKAIDWMNRGDPFRILGKLISLPIVLPIKLTRMITDKGLRDHFTYDMDNLTTTSNYNDKKDSLSGHGEYESEKIKLIASNYIDISGQYDFVINGGAVLPDISKMKDLLTPEGTYMIMSTPDSHLHRKETDTLFSNQRELWVELKGKKKSDVYTAFIGTDK